MMSIEANHHPAGLGARPADRSAPRARVAAGDHSTDRRGRMRGAPAILSYGFRPFFLGAAVYAALAIPFWLWVYAHGVELSGPFQGSAWHAHEMIFGYLAAVIAGFILTAVPNWTGRLPISGPPLALLVAFWIAGRIACAALGAPVFALIVDMAFPAALAGAVWREVVAGKNWRNAPVAALLTFFALANLLHHLENFWPALDGIAVRLALGVTAMLIALIGGRITPSFTRNWLVKSRSQALPASFGWPDKTALASTGLGVLAWIVAPERAVTGALLVLGGVLLTVRLSRWQGLATWREPIVLILHLGYLWLAVSLAMLGLSVLAPDLLPLSSALHALTAGAIATMTLAVMTRATRGHTGRAIESDRLTVALYAAAIAGAVLRVAAPLVPAFYMHLLVCGGLLWSLAFVLFAWRYGPMLVKKRAG